MKTYRDLEVWKKAMDLVVNAYGLAKTLPNEERYGLVSQIQRAAVSVPANIAEGYGRSHRGDYLRHLSVARGSLAELETLMTLAVRLEYLERERVLPTWEAMQEVGRMLTGLVKSLNHTNDVGDTPKP